MNAFENGSRRMIPAVLVYATTPFSFLRGNIQDLGNHGVGGESSLSKIKDDTKAWLMIHRTDRDGDIHSGKWNGLGGKLEPDESALAAAIREFEEEAGVRLLPSQLSVIGVLHFPNFKASKNQDWLVWVFKVELFKEQIGLVKKSCAEGQLHWVAESQVLGLNLWPGDKEFLPEVFAGKPFVGTIKYLNGQLAGSEIVPMTKL